MECSKMLSDSFEYTRECLDGKWKKWLLLIISAIIFPLMQGYLVRIYKGIQPAPEVEDWAGRFIDGIKILIIAFIYLLIPIVIFFLFVFAGLMSVGATGGSDAGILSFILGMGIAVILLPILLLLAYLLIPIAFVRFARTDSLGQALQVGEIINHIGKIGWINYILALIALAIAMVVIGIIFYVLMIVLLFIPILGWILLPIVYLAFIPAALIFIARYMTLVYDSAA